MYHYQWSVGSCQLQTIKILRMSKNKKHLMVGVGVVVRRRRRVSVYTTTGARRKGYRYDIHTCTHTYIHMIYKYI
jgi:hypothetical protein